MRRPAKPKHKHWKRKDEEVVKTPKLQTMMNRWICKKKGPRKKVGKESRYKRVGHSYNRNERNKKDY